MRSKFFFGLMAVAGIAASGLIASAAPAEDDNTRTIAAVYQRGKEVDRAAMRAGWMQ